MASRDDFGNLILMAALALAVSSAAAQGPPKPVPGKAEEPGTVKKILNKGADIKAAGAKRAAAADAVGAKLRAQEVPDEASSSPAGAKGPAAGGTPGDKRDPFVVPIKTVDPKATPATLPPGNLGLMISSANMLGVVKSSKGMIAMVGGSAGRTYFLKENDKVWNGRVTKITVDSAVFEETVIDPLGQSSKREVVKKLTAEGK